MPIIQIGECGGLGSRSIDPRDSKLGLRLCRFVWAFGRVRGSGPWGSSTKGHSSGFTGLWG